MAHREPGIGQVRAGLVKPPRVCFDLRSKRLVRARAAAPRPTARRREAMKTRSIGARIRATRTLG